MEGVVRGVNWLRRLKFIATGRAEWVDVETGEVEIEQLHWGARWAIAGIHSHRWWWVRKWGRESCGCSINPLTRRRVMFNMDCEKHCGYLKEPF